MQINAPSRLQTPLKRVGPRGAGKFVPISWDEALDLATDWLKPIRNEHPEKLAFFTGRDQSQSFTSFWARAFGTPNYAAHGGFCSVNMAAAGIYTMGGSFWEFGQPDWERTKLLMLFGLAEDHDSNPIKIGLGKIKSRGAKVIAVNPIRSGYNAIADEWLGITPGTDGLFILSLVHCLLQAGKIDLPYLSLFTNAPALINDNPDSPEYGLLLRDKQGKLQVIDRHSGELAAYDAKNIRPNLAGTWQDQKNRYKTVFLQLSVRYMQPQYAPEQVAEQCGIKAQRIRAIAAELARVAFAETIEIQQGWTDFRGQKHQSMIGRPVSFHAMRGISAHANGFQTCRALHLLQILLGSVETPGGFRFKPPYPKPVAAHPKPNCHATPNQPLAGPHLGFVQGPEDLCLQDGTNDPARIDKAFSWEHPLAAHGMMHMVISNAHAANPYKIDVLFMYMANMAWNSSMHTRAVIDMLTDKDDEGEYRIPKFIYCDAYSSETVAYADLVLPDTTYLERHDCISLLDRPISEADLVADAIRWPVVEPDRDVRCFQSVLCELGAKLGLEGFVDAKGQAKYRDYADYMLNFEARPGIGPLAGFRGKRGNKFGRGEPNPSQLQSYIDNGGFATKQVPDEARFYKPWNQAYQQWAVEMGFYDTAQPYIFDLYCETLRRFQLAAAGHGKLQPPQQLRERIKKYFDPLPIWYSFAEQDADYPLHALTQRPMAMYHSWGSQNAWLRQIHGHNPLYVSSKIWEQYKFQEGDWAHVISPHGKITVPVALMKGLNENTVWTWNAIGKRKGAWALDENAPEANKGFLLNHLISELLPMQDDGMRWSNSDPVTGQAAWFDLRVQIAKAEKHSQSQPIFPPIESPVEKGPKQVLQQVGRA